MHNKKCMSVAALIVLACAAAASAETATLFRVFLNDGTAIVSYGEYARVGDRVVFSMPIGNVAAESDAAPRLHMVNIPATAVNWTATTKYADSARFARYVATTAESDYAALAGEVAAALNAIIAASEPHARLRLAVAARQRLASWPRDHHGYRSRDVGEMLGLLDEAINGLRVAAGETSFTLEMIAAPPQPETVPMLPVPTAGESIAQAVAIARVTDIAADRVSILRGIVAALDDPSHPPPDKWIETRQWAVTTIGEEARADRQYAGLVASALRQATAAASRADVRRVESVIRTVARRDALLGKKRPDEVNSLLAQVQVQLDAARRLRLARDQWQERLGSYRAYMRSVAPIFETFRRAQRTLDDIKKLAGSEATVLVGFGERLGAGVKALGVVTVPDELKGAHAVLVSAVTLADNAVRTRRQAVMSGELRSAWDASSAAAGSMMLFAKAREDMEAIVKLPQTR
jgi:hypothetical protein